MTLATNDVITYKDLIDYALTKVKSICHNIGAYSSSVPAQYRTSSVENLVRSQAIPATVKVKTGHRPNFTAYMYVGTVPDSALAVVSEATVNNDFNSFMTSRGVSAKPDTVVTFKLLTNFFANLAAFISARTWLIYNPMVGTRGIVFYHSGSVTYPAVSVPMHSPTYTGDKKTFYKLKNNHYDGDNSVYEVTTVNEPNEPGDSESGFPKSTFLTSVTELCNAMGNTTGIHQVNMYVRYTSCSSCSSSCSSSSSSSSSSIFIAYMEI